LGKYRLIAELGHGGMADVYLAVAQGLGGFNKLLVLKQLRPALVDDSEFLTMFLDEARLAARLSHPNVVHTYEVGRDGSRYFIAMEYLEGQPLNRIVRRAERAGGLPPDLYLTILVHALSGLHYAHELKDYDGTPLKVVHRDLTPHNIFVTYSGEVKLVDFGIAKALDSTAETRAGVLKGKLAYMSPEQARSEVVDRRADIFSAGVMVWEAISRKRMWPALEGVAILQQLVTGDVPSIDEAAPSASDRVRRIVHRALAVSREDRFSSAADLQTAIEGYLSDRGAHYSQREIGEFVAGLFPDDRQKIAAVIDDRLRLASSLPSAGLGPVQAIPRLHVGGFSGSSIPTGNIEPGDGSDRSLGIELRLNSSSAPSMTGGPMVGMGGADGAKAKARRPWFSMVLGAALAVAVALLGLKVLRGSGHQAPAPQAPAASPELVPSAAAPAPDADAAAPAEVEVRVSVTPAHAKLYLDGQLLAGNPHTGRYARDGKTHTVRAEAAGFGTATHEVVFERDLLVELALQRGRRPVFVAAPAVTTPREPAKAQPTSTQAPGDPMELDKTPAKKKPRRPIDTENPWQ
jgi:serine/threonine-protein kinase